MQLHHIGYCCRDLNAAVTILKNWFEYLKKMQWNDIRVLASAIQYNYLIPILERDFAKPYAIIKGEVLSVLAYGKEGCRHTGDIDVLINKKDTCFLADVLKRHGFSQRHLCREAEVMCALYSHQNPPFSKKRVSVLGFLRGGHGQFHS